MSELFNQSAYYAIARDINSLPTGVVCSEPLQTI